MLPIEYSPFSISTLLSEVQFSKTLLLILKILLGINICSKAVQESNVCLGITVNLSDSLMFLRFLHSYKQAGESSVKEFGSIISVSPVFAKANFVSPKCANFYDRRIFCRRRAYECLKNGYLSRIQIYRRSGKYPFAAQDYE